MFWPFLQLQKILNNVISIGVKLTILISKVDATFKLVQKLLALENQAVQFSFDCIKPDGEIEENSMATILTDTQQFTLTLKPLTANKKPAPVEAGSVIWTGPNFVEITPSADGMSALIKALTVGANDNISASADADLGAGVVTISGTYEVSVIASQAQTLGFEASEPEEQTPVTPVAAKK